MRGGGSLMDEPPYILGNDMVRDQPVYLTVPERRQHVSIVGRTGSGKTTLMFGMLVNDLAAGRGFVFIDPHGDTARRLADAVPKDRIRNVIYFHPADPEYAMSWNALTPTEPMLRWTTAASIVEIFRTIWKNTWGARLDYILTQGITLLLQKPGSTLAELPQLLTDPKFRQKFLDKSDDEHLVRYWRTRFDALSPKLRDETLSPIDNKIGQPASGGGWIGWMAPSRRRRAGSRRSDRDRRRADRFPGSPSPAAPRRPRRSRPRARSMPCRPPRPCRPTAPASPSSSSAGSSSD